MVAIILSPGETFEHNHKTASLTKLTCGACTVMIGNSSHELTVGQSLTIPPDTSHQMVNTGPDIAIIQCYHELPPDPSKP